MKLRRFPQLKSHENERNPGSSRSEDWKVKAKEIQNNSMERNLRKENWKSGEQQDAEEHHRSGRQARIKHPIYGKFVHKTTKFMAPWREEQAGIVATLCWFQKPVRWAKQALEISVQVIEKVSNYDNAESRLTVADNSQTKKCSLARTGTGKRYAV